MKEDIGKTGNSQSFLPRKLFIDKVESTDQEQNTKILERIMHNRVCNYLAEQKILCSRQRHSQTVHSTEPSRHRT